MTALSKIASVTPQELYDHLDTVIEAYEEGSVITVDNSISVFAELAGAGATYDKKVYTIIIRHPETCRSKEVGQHAERAFVCISDKNAGLFRMTLLKRYDSSATPQKKRIDTFLRKIDEGRYGT